jgi:LacI family transcriptional regulator
VIRYHHEHGPWSLYFQPQGLEAPPPPWLGSWRGDGILARINDRRMADAVLRAGVPAVDLRGALRDVRLPLVGIDNRLVVKLAVEHFIDRGFRHFAFCGTPVGENRGQDERADRFARAIRTRGFDCDVFPNPGGGNASWDEEQSHIADWLRGLPKPVALMTCHDDRGRQVLDACLRAQLIVPDEVAILGVDNDPFLCNLCTPALSSVDVNPEQIGYEAAAMLNRLMNGGRVRLRPLFLEPRGLVVRPSTDVTAVDDPHVAAAARLIRDHSNEPISIKQLLAGVPVSRSALFRRFKEQLGRSPKAELTRVRLENAKELLRNSTLPISAVAERVGYAEAKHFISVFRAVEGITPLRYRARSTASRATLK